MMNRSFGLTLSLLCAGIGLFAADAAHGFGELPVGAVIRELSAHAQERQGQRIVVADPAEAKRLGLTNKEIYVVRVQGRAGAIPLQWDERSKVPYFVLPTQPAGEKATVAIVPVESYPGEASVEHAYLDDQLWMTVLKGGAQRKLFAFQHDELLPPGIKPVYRRAGFIHPVLTPSGETISGSFAPDHAHHHGIWTAWSHTDFQGRHPDFWNVHLGSGRVEYVGLGARWIGPVDSGFHAQMRSIDTQSNPGTIVLEETWRVSVYQPRPGLDLNVFELEVAQRNASPDPLTLTKHIYGGLGYRGLESWTTSAPLTFVTSEGHVGRKAGDGQRARWFAFAGPTAKGRGGIAILDHPDNPRFPQWTRFNPKDPFVAFTPVHDESLSIRSDETIRLRFRFLTFDGEPDIRLIEAYWQGFARPAQASAK